MNPKLARVHQMIVHVNLRQVSVQSVSHLSKYWHQYHGQKPGCCWQVGRGGHAHADMCAHVCIPQEREMDVQTELCLQAYQRPGQPLLAKSREEPELRQP